MQAGDLSKIKHEEEKENSERITPLLLAVVFLAGSHSVVVQADESVSDDAAAFSYISISADEIQRTLNTLTLPRTARSLTLIEIRDIRLNGDFIEVIGNFEARNFHLRGTMFVSGLTVFTSATADGRYIRPTGGSVQISVAGLLSALPGATGTVATILSSISATRPGTNLVQGSNLGLAPNTRAFGFTFDRAKLDSPDHHLSLNAFASFAPGGDW